MENLGKQGKDMVSGFKGIITGICIYLHGSKTYQLTGKSIDGKKPEEHWVYTQDVKVGKESGGFWDESENTEENRNFKSDL